MFSSEALEAYIIAELYIDSLAVEDMYGAYLC